jgi:hypothetical protein
MTPGTARKKTTTPAPPGIGEQINNLPPEFLRCRDLSHDWDVPKGFFKVELEGGVRGALYVEREVVCRSCGSVKTELFRVHRRFMERLGPPAYKRPKGYDLVGPKKGEPIKGMVQLALYMHSIADFNGLT